MIRKTYGVSGLTDWTTQIKAGKATVSVHFSGGALTAYGVTPATYSTANPFFQTVIEDSEYFKNGRIMLLGQTEVAGEPKPKARKDNAEPAAPVSEVSDAEPAGLSQEEAAGLKVVEVSDKNEAIAWLKDNYPDKGYGSSKLRSQTAFGAACAECGVEFVFTA